MRMRKRTQKTEELNIGTRYPLDVLSAIKDLAQKHERSFNSEVVWALRQYINQQRGKEQECANLEDK